METSSKRGDSEVSDAGALWNKLHTKVVRAPRLKNSMVMAFGHNFTVKHGTNKIPRRSSKRRDTPVHDEDAHDFEEGEDTEMVQTRAALLGQIKTSRRGGGDKGRGKDGKSREVGTAPPSAPRTPGLFDINDFSDMFEESYFDKIKSTGKVPDVADAFTSRSIHQGVMDGMYNFEQMKQLGKIGMFKERREAYSRAYPVIVPPFLDKMAELKNETLDLSLPVCTLLDRDEVLGEWGAQTGKGEGEFFSPSDLPDLSYLAKTSRPKTTGGIQNIGEPTGRQNWRGYKNLVREFNRSVKNLRKPPHTPAGVNSTSSRKKAEYYPPGTAPEKPSTFGRQGLTVEMNTRLADQLENDMSDSDDDDGLVVDDSAKTGNGSGNHTDDDGKTSFRPIGEVESKTSSPSDSMAARSRRITVKGKNAKHQITAKKGTGRKVGKVGKGGQDIRKRFSLFMEQKNLLNDEYNRRTSPTFKGGGDDANAGSPDQRGSINRLSPTNSGMRRTRSTSNVRNSMVNHAEQRSSMKKSLRISPTNSSMKKNSLRSPKGGSSDQRGSLRRLSPSNSVRSPMASSGDQRDSFRRIRSASNIRSPQAGSGDRNSSFARLSPVMRLPDKWTDLDHGSFGPNYSLDEVKHFYECFCLVDKDLSGEITANEWQEFLGSMKQKVSPTDSRRLFMHIDANNNGAISMEEICRVVFNKASEEQLMIMLNIMSNSTGIKKSLQVSSTLEFTRADLRQLFDVCDVGKKRRLEVSELEAALSTMGVKRKNLDKIFRGIRSSHSTEKGSYNVEEFVDCLHSYINVVG